MSKIVLIISSLFVLVTLLSQVHVHAFPSGAHASACETYMPRHALNLADGTGGLTGTNNYNLTAGTGGFTITTPGNFTPGVPVPIFINGTTTFRGILLVVLLSNGTKAGTWTNVTALFQFRCGVNAMTHKSRVDKNNTVFYWVPPTYSGLGNVTVQATIVQTRTVIFRFAAQMNETVSSIGPADPPNTTNPPSTNAPSTLGVTTQAASVSPSTTNPPSTNAPSTLGVTTQAPSTGTLTPTISPSSGSSSTQTVSVIPSNSPVAETTKQSTTAKSTTVPPQTLPPTTKPPVNPFGSKCNFNTTKVCDNRPAGSSAYCAVTQSPEYNFQNCCNSCRKCDAEAFSKCLLKSVVYCPFGQNSTANINPCCPSCVPLPKPPTCTAALKEQIPKCSDPRYQVVNSTDPNGCPACVSSTGRDSPIDTGCPKPSVNCSVGVPPTRDSSGCLVCLPVAEAKRPGQCTGSVADKNNCFQNILPTLRHCSSDEYPVYNSSNCCLSCAPGSNNNAVVGPAPSPQQSGQNLSPANRCSRSDVATCLSKMPTCGPDDIPINLPTQCCPSCTLPMQVCSADVVVSCINTTRVCDSGETPSYVSGECCPTCRRSKPASICPPSIGTMCTRTDSATTGYCLPYKSTTILLNSTDSAKQSAISNYVIADLYVFFRVLFTRYCAGLTDVDFCNVFNLLDGLDVKIHHLSRLTDGSISFIVDAASTSLSGSNFQANRRLKAISSSTSFSDAITSVTQDPIAASGYSAGITASEVAATDAPVTTAPSALDSLSQTSIIIIAVVVGVVFLILLAYIKFRNAGSSAVVYAEVNAPRVSAENTGIQLTGQMPTPSTVKVV